MTFERDHRIDFFRGLALIFIFWDHVPHNPLGQITLRNVGFSDAAEIFVFLAGYAAVLAYGKILARDGYLIACVKILRRAWVLYVVHIFLLAMLMGIVFFANSHVETRDLVEEMGLHHFITNPQQALTDELLLRFKPNLMDPLPLYIVLLAGLPLVLPLLVRKPWAVVAVSLAVYLLAPRFGWNLAAIKDGVWYFNPVTWQLLFVLGGFMAIHGQRPRVPDTRPLLRQPLFVSAAVYVVVAGVITVSWRWPQIHDALMPASLSNLLYPISKTDLSPVRPGAGLCHRQALARQWLDAKLAGAAMLPHGALLTGSFLPRRAVGAVGGHAQRPDRRCVCHAGFHRIGGCRGHGVAGGVAGFQQTPESATVGGDRLRSKNRSLVSLDSCYRGTCLPNPCTVVNRDSCSSCRVKRGCDLLTLQTQKPRSSRPGLFHFRCYVLRSRTHRPLRHIGRLQLEHVEQHCQQDQERRADIERHAGVREVRHQADHQHQKRQRQVRADRVQPHLVFQTGTFASAQALAELELGQQDHHPGPDRAEGGNRGDPDEDCS